MGGKPREAAETRVDGWGAQGCNRGWGDGWGTHRGSGNQGRCLGSPERQLGPGGMGGEATGAGEMCEDSGEAVGVGGMGGEARETVGARQDGYGAWGGSGHCGMGGEATHNRGDVWGAWGGSGGRGMGWEAAGTRSTKIHVHPGHHFP